MPGEPKVLLRAAISDRVPTTVASRPKQPFRIPEETWYRDDLRAWVRSSLMSGETVSTEFVNRDFVRGVVSEHLGGHRNRRHLLWSLLCFEYWCRVFLSGSVGTKS